MKRIAVQIDGGIVLGAHELNEDDTFGEPILITVLDHDTDGADPKVDDIRTLDTGKEVLVYEA